MGLLANADVQLLSDKWRSTVQSIALTLAVTLLGALAAILTGEIDYILMTLGLLFVINRKALDLDMKKLTKLLKERKQP